MSSFSPDIEHAIDLDTAERARLAAEDALQRAREIGWREVREIAPTERWLDLTTEARSLEDSGRFVVVMRHDAERERWGMWRRPRGQASEAIIAAIRESDGGEWDGEVAA